MNIKKITEYDLDPELLRKLLTSGSSINLDTLLIDYYKKSEEINETSIPNSYTDKLLNKIDVLNQSIDNFRNKNDNIQTSDLDSEILNKLNKIDVLETLLNNLSTSSGNSASSDIKIKALESDLNDISASIVKNNETLENLKNNTADITIAVNNNKSSIDNIWSAFDNYKLKTDLITQNDVDQEIQKLLNKIRDLDNSNQGLQVIGDPEEYVYLQNGNVVITKKLIRNDIVLCFTEEDINKAIEKKEEIIIDAVNNIIYEINETISYLETVNETGEESKVTETENGNNSDAIEEPIINDEVNYDSKNLADSSTYNNIFCIDKETHNTYAILNGQIYSLSKSNKIIETILPPNDVYTINDSNINYSRIHVLALDEDQDSITNREYISADAFITVSYIDSGCKIYNETTEALTLKIVL